MVANGGNRRQGMEIPLQQAQSVLDFLRDIADIMIDHYLVQKEDVNGLLKQGILALCKLDEAYD